MDINTMDTTTLLIAFIILIAPGILGVLFARRYNFIHGILTILFGIVLIYGIYQLCGYLAPKISALSNIQNYLSLSVEYNFMPLKLLMEKFNLGFLVKQPMVYIIVFAGFAVCQFFASKARKARKARD